MFYDKYAMSSCCIRIGTCVDKPYDRRTLVTWISPRDMQQLTIVSLEAEIGFEIVYGVSGNDLGLWDNARALAIGYCPQDNSERFAEEILMQPDGEDQAAARFHGGSFAAADLVEKLALRPDSRVAEGAS